LSYRHKNLELSVAISNRAVICQLNFLLQSKTISVIVSFVLCNYNRIRNGRWWNRFTRKEPQQNSLTVSTL